MKPVEAEAAVEAAGRGSVAELLGLDPCPVWCTLEHEALEGRGWDIDSDGPVRFHEVSLPSPPGVDLYTRTRERMDGRLGETRIGGIESQPLTPNEARELGQALIQAADFVEASAATPPEDGAACPR